MGAVSALKYMALSMLIGVPAAAGNAALAPICGDALCSSACTGSEGPAAAADCTPAPGANSTAPLIQKDCYEHSVFGEECSACNVTASCPSWCDDVRAAGCRPYELICGYVETVEFQGPLEDLVTRGPLFCRTVDCDAVGVDEADACWFTVEGHEVCCVDGVPTYTAGTQTAVPGYGGVTEPEPAMGPSALAPGDAEPSGAAARVRGRGPACVAAAVAVVLGTVALVT